MNNAIESISRHLQWQIAEWTALQFEIHCPDHARVMRLMEEGWYAEARLILERMKAYIVEDRSRPYWRALEIDGQIVAEHDFTPVGVPLMNPNPPRNLQEHIDFVTAELERVLSIPAHFFAVSADDLPNWARGRTLENQELASTNHVDAVNRVDRDDRRRRQKRMGQLFVKYGVTT